MIELIDVKNVPGLDEYASYAHLSGFVEDLRQQAQNLICSLKNRTVWMVNSTADGGGVAEMMPKLVGLLRELGVKANWIVINTHEDAFFSLTKRIHNLIHDSGEPGFNDEHRKLYQRISQESADEIAKLLSPEDILVIHDPQPLGAGAELKRRMKLRSIWRCHIGLERRTLTTDSAWDFLKPYMLQYDHLIFTAKEYIPFFITRNVSIIHPAIDPLAHKNREITGPELAEILCHAGLMKNGHHPFLTPPWNNKVLRLRPDGSFTPADLGQDIGLLFRPIITQVSRWDRLKGWEYLIRAFVTMKHKTSRTDKKHLLHNRRLNAARLVLAGPEPAAVQDDPEGKEVLDQLCRYYQELAPKDQEDVVLLTLPMKSRRQNHLMVNAIQRCSSVIVQNSLQEGFGLTATEAMWKKIPVLGSSSYGLRLQIRDGIDGRLTMNPKDSGEIAATLDHMLAQPASLEKWGRSAQRRVYDHFLIFSQAKNWIKCLETVSRS